MKWRLKAKCVGSDSSYWFEDQPTVLTFRACADCPVRMDCLSEAMDRHWTEDVGIWGWTTPRQRRLMRQRKLTLAQAWDGSASWLMEHDSSYLLEQEVRRGSSRTEPREAS
jgi:hypothetical protein